MKKSTKISFMVTSSVVFIVFLLGVFFINYMVGYPLKDALEDETISSLDDYLELSPDPDFVTFVPEELRGEKSSPTYISTDPVLGSSDAIVQMVVFGDHVSEASNLFLPEIISVLDNNSEIVNLTWKDFPIPRMYGASLIAAQAARCVQNQDKELFWSMRELLMENREDINIDIIKTLANNFDDIDQDTFSSCLENEETLTLVQKNYLEAKNLGLDIPPILFIDGERYFGKYVKDSILDYIQSL